ncbi:MAG: hypothetical protein ABSH50_12610 [Bryobacteraceae bacterium]
MLLVRRYAWRVLPLLLLLAFYWPGLTNWFYQDDFGWLNLRHDVQSLRDLGPALFAPKAHGNIRPLGENAYFLVLSSLFGVDALPFRICAFGFQMASLLLLGSIVARLTKSRAAGFCAQILWMADSGLAAAMCWTSIFNQILSGFFFLLAFWFFLRHIESGAARDAAGHWAAFVLGLGALEINVVYPAIAAAYALLFARAHLKKALPTFAVSALAIGAHFHFAPAPGAGVYALHWDGGIFGTLWTYWMWALGPSRSIAWLLTGAVLALLVWCTVKRQWLGIFGIAWFAITIGPYLQLSEHKMDYYLTVPAIGIAILGGWAMARVWRPALIGAAIYLTACVPHAWSIVQWNHARGTRVEDMVLGVAQIHEAQPGQYILLDGVDSDLFWSGIADLPFRAMEIPHVYLSPGSEARIQAPADLVVKYVLPEAPAWRALQDGRLAVYQAGDGALRNVTSRYRTMAGAVWKPETPRFINLGDDAFAAYLGAGWEPCAQGYRWLRGTGTVRIGGARQAGERLHVGIFRTTPFQLLVRFNGVPVTAEISHRGGELTELVFPAGAGPEIQVTLENLESEPLRFGYLEVN